MPYSRRRVDSQTKFIFSFEGMMEEAHLLTSWKILFAYNSISMVKEIFDITYHKEVLIKVEY